MCAQADPRPPARWEQGAKAIRVRLSPGAHPQVMNGVSGERLKAPRRRQTNKTKQRSQHRTRHQALDAQSGVFSQTPLGPSGPSFPDTEVHACGVCMHITPPHTHTNRLSSAICNLFKMLQILQ